MVVTEINFTLKQSIFKTFSNTWEKKYYKDMAVINNNCYRLIVNSQVKCYLKGHFTQNVNSIIYN